MTVELTTKGLVCSSCGEHTIGYVDAVCGECKWCDGCNECPCCCDGFEKTEKADDTEARLRRERDGAVAQRDIVIGQVSGLEARVAQLTRERDGALRVIRAEQVVLSEGVAKISELRQLLADTRAAMGKGVGHE